MAVPMTVRGRTSGALAIISVTPTHHFNCNDLEFAQEIARRVALAFDNAKLFRTVNRTARVSRFLAEAAHSLSESLEPDEVLRRVTRLAVSFFADFAVAYVRNVDGVTVPVAWAHQDSSKEELVAEAAPLQFSPQGGLGKSMSRALATGEPYLVANVTEETLRAEHPRVRELLALLRPISWITVPLVARNEVHGAIAFAVTDPDRRFQADDVALCQRLASRVALAMQNARFYQNVQQALTTRDEVLAVVSHDLRNPLQTIGLSVQLLQELSPTEASQRRQLDRISRAKDRMDRLIQDLLDVVRLEAGRSISIECRRESPSFFITEASESFVPSANGKGVRFSRKVPEGLPEVWVDSGRMVQVLSNLLANALKFTPQGGEIEVQAEEAHGTVHVHVRDTGVGIPQEDLDQIIHAFWQAPRTARAGAGLGLAISRGIIEQHGGRISVKSKEGAGATFTFTLPVAREQGQAQAAD
jgi:signal transduction histidine kinase